MHTEMAGTIGEVGVRIKCWLRLARESLCGMNTKLMSNLVDIMRGKGDNENQIVKETSQEYVEYWIYKRNYYGIYRV